MPNNDTPISSFQDATEINSADKLTGLQNNVNRNFSFSTILSWFVTTVAAAFVPVSRKVNNKALSADITLDASDVGAQAAITASGILKGDGAGGVSAAVAGTDYGTYSKPSGGIPSSDMTSAVQTSLGKAVSAYQKPSGGIPASDLASGVIPTVPLISTATPQMDGVGAAGSTGEVSDAGHTHPRDTSKANETEIAYVETGTTTSRAYSVGEYFCWNGLLYQVTSPISSGGTFTPGTNCKNVTGGIASQLLAAGNARYTQYYKTSATTTDHAVSSDSSFLVITTGVSSIGDRGMGLWMGFVSASSSAACRAYKVFEPSGVAYQCTVSATAGKISVTNAVAYVRITILTFERTVF